ncbi:MAG: hypothetical protein ACYCSI_08215 [Solirubrobacteraceae bacterium]
MLERWLTSRCWRADAAALTTAKGAIVKFLSEQDQLSSGTEPFAAGARPDTFTFHFGTGRGVRWHDRPRGLLWLCAFEDRHDRGYEHARRLQDAGSLYPDIEHSASAAESALLPWGVHVDEDAHEWARAIYGALETWELSAEQLAAGQTVSYPAAVYLELSKDEDEIWTLVIRRRLAYLNIDARQRERWLTNDEINAIFCHLAGQPDEDDYEFENPPHPQAFLFAQVHFLSGAITPAAWLRQVCDAATAGAPPKLVTG